MNEGKAREILQKAHSEGYLAGIDGDDPLLDKLMERQLLADLRKLVEGRKRGNFSQTDIVWNSAIDDVLKLLEG